MQSLNNETALNVKAVAYSYILLTFNSIIMKQSEKLLKLKDAGTILITLGIAIMCLTPAVMIAREVYDIHAWLTVWRWGVGIAFSGLAIRIARFLWLW